MDTHVKIEPAVTRLWLDEPDVVEADVLQHAREVITTPLDSEPETLELVELLLDLRPRATKEEQEQIDGFVEALRTGYAALSWNDEVTEEELIEAIFGPGRED